MDKVIIWYLDGNYWDNILESALDARVDFNNDQEFHDFVYMCFGA